MKNIGELNVESKFISGGVATFSAGSVSAPGIAFTTKTNTGLTLAATKLQTVYNGSAQFSADANGLLIESGKKIQFVTGGDLTPSATKISLSSTLTLEVLSTSDASIVTSGGISAAKNVGGYSDISLKKDFEMMELTDEQIESFLSIVPQFYKRIDLDDEQELGLIANELYDKGFHFLVGETTHAVQKKKIKTVKYDRVSLYLMHIMQKMWKNNNK